MKLPQVLTNSFTAVGAGSSLRVPSRGTFLLALQGTFDATVALEKSSDGSNWESVESFTTTQTAKRYENATGKTLSYRLRCTAFTTGTAVGYLAEGNLIDDAVKFDAKLGAVAQPTSGIVAALLEELGPRMYRVNLRLVAARIPVTDAAGSGSYGTLKLFDFVEAAVSYLGCRQDYTAFAEGAALTTAAGDAAFAIGIGTAAIAAAADGTLATANKDIGGSISVTLSGGTGVGTDVTGAGKGVNGTGTATDLNLNWSGSAATIDASSTIDVTGTVTVVVVLLGDD